jgi:hypothetical protein
MTKQLENNAANRANEVSQQLVKITNDTKNNFFTICDLILESVEGDYHKYFGCKNFTEWIDQSEFDFSSRTAYYYLSIGKKTRELGLTKEELSEIPISKLKEILSLEPSSHEQTIRALIEESDSLSVEEVKQKVKGIKHKAGEDIFVHYNFKVTETAVQVIEDCFELIRRGTGNYVDQTTGEVVEISNSRCFELACASYTEDDNNKLPKVEVLVS